MLGEGAAPAVRALADRLPVPHLAPLVERTIRQIGPAAVAELRNMAKDPVVPADLRKRVAALAVEIETGK
jgi:hypothetical protein